MRYPYLLFDADNTLFDFNTNELTSYKDTIARQGIPFSEGTYAVYHRCNAELWHEYDLGLCSKEFLLVERFRRFLKEIDAVGDPEVMNHDHLTGLARATQLIPGALELCRMLSMRHSMYIVTNAVESVQRKRFASSALAPYFKGVFISETIGFGKPNVAFFDYVFQAVPGMTRENTLLIGDSLSSDIQGANNAGIPCCWYNPNGLPRPDTLRIDYEVKTLPEIFPVADQ